MFKQFDIDYDRLTIDGVEIKKPSYVSVSEWLAFWEMFDGEFVSQKVDTAFNKGYDCRGNEQDKEIEQVKEACFDQLNRLEENIENLIQDMKIDAYDNKLTNLKNYIEAARDEIWQL